MPVPTLAALRGLCFFSTSGLFRAFSSRHARKKHRDTTLSNRAAQFIHPKPLSIQPCCCQGFSGSRSPGDRAEAPRRAGRAQGTGSPRTPRGTVTRASPHASCSSSRRVFLISAPSLPGLAGAAAATSGEVSGSGAGSLPAGRLRAGA